MKVLKNRQVIFDDINTQNENNVTEINLQVPSEYEDFNKKIVFITPDGIFWDLFVEDKYLINKSITKYERVKFYIWLTKEEQDFRSIEYQLKFNHNEDANGQITEEEISGVITVVNLLEEEIVKVKDLQQEVKDLINDIQNKLDSGYFKGEKGDRGDKGEQGTPGKDYILTDADKTEIADKIINQLDAENQEY